MATQCRSSKCTAERRGFRRELDSWRYKLIHCVGFESILEGIYGPRLLQDLNIFDDCEPEDIADWSTDARCSFCNLHLEKISDHLPIVASPGSSPPAETPPPQGLSTSDKLQCQADRFLHAVFCKKEFPESCDPSIPLAAQELMRKMIRQFAIEFASKSQAFLGRDSLRAGSAELPKLADPDGPLDLRVSRTADCSPQAEGVLDLSKKNVPSLKVLNVHNHQKGSGSLRPMDEDQCRQGGDNEASEDCRGTVLERVLSSLCSYHRILFYHMLQDIREDHRESLALRDAHRRLSKTEPHCCHTGRKPPDETSMCPAGSTCAACLTTCRLRTCAVTSVCVCMKTLTGLACQNVALGCVGKVICPSCTVCFAHHKILACQHQHNGDDADNTHAGKKRSVIQPPGHLSQDACAGCRSPSPPPLSPVPIDADFKMSEKNMGCCGQERSTPPPPLLPHRTETEVQHSRTVPGGATCPPVVKEGLTSEAYAKTEKENGDQCGSLMGEFMDKFTEKLKVIQPTPSSQVVQNSKVCDDAHLTEIITTVLHNSSNKEYNLTELLEQHVTTEQRSPQTRSRRRQEVLVTVSKSNVPASCRELTWLDHPVCRSKLVHERSNYPKNIKSDLPSTSSVVEQSSVPEQTSKMAEMVPTQDLSVSQNSSSDSSRPISNVNCESPSQEEEEKPLQTANQRELLPLSKTDCVCHEKTIAEAFQGKIKALKKKGKVGRSRRNIVPPQRFSSYVTEPRKMYYAACFSESIFNRRTPKVKATSKYGSPEGEYHTYTETGTEHPVKTEGQDHILHPQRQEKNTFTVSLEKMGEDQIGGNSCLKRSPRTMKKSNENSTSPSKRLKCGLESQSAELTLCQSVDTDDCKDTRKSSIKYSSPIKLMLVSPVKGEDGIKYTLKAADSSSYSHGEMFDPCVEASWAGNAVKDLNEYLRTDSVESAEFESISSKLPKETESCDEADLDNHANGSGETFPATRETTPVKRRPGRPKKLGPQIEKAVKRPIGRPPKPKAGEISSLNGKNVVNQRANDISSEEDGNKNLKITIMYGRSRKARRVVSEDFGHLSTEQHLYEGDTNSTNKTYSRWMNTSGNSVLAAKDQLEDLNFVTPCLEDKGIIRSSSNIKCQKQNDMAVTRKPGRPPKVKISGISVTVTTVSPRQRKIHMRRDMKESPLQRRFLAMECESSKEQKTINQQPDDILRSEMDTMKQDTEQSQVSLAPVRHSVRERKPSIHLLHSVATARSFSRSNALVQRSHKLLMNSANIKTRYLMQCGPKVASNNALSNKRSTLSCMQDVVRFSGISVDSIFASNESLKWWPISASPETLNEELSRRIKLMSDTWVSDALEANTSEDTKMNQMSKPCEKITSSAESSSSAVKMLFEKNYSMEKLCSWFMQTTETQSLAIVKKVSARNRYEAFHYNPIRPTCSVNVCRSPQAERLRKHVKKFAKVVPKSPAMYQRAEMYNTRRSLAKTYPFTPSKAVLIPGEKQKTSRSCGTWHVYQTALLRARMKFKTRAKKILTNKVEDKVHRNQIGSSIQKTSVLKELLTSLNEKQDASKFTESKSIEVKASEKTMDIAAISREQRISSKAWSPETLKECRVFLKKINSPNTKLMTEECNICTVKFNISPAGCEIAMEQEEKKSDEVVKFEKTCSSSRKPPSSAMNQSTVNKLGRKRGSCRGESPPAKLARQSRSSRGVLGARWCDFVLGPSK
ncbi:uncharacterized protein lcorl isoform X1 [Electrophorus electricus]|uniref:uncharacterized protein lcorl isoform X1 n=1 Tax=Electrophorus electricus TaxID=8005 RepID=UPI0015D025D9|nr:uncharacterized protein lcorl isoform X1 [Electrophorus electricus]